MKRIVNISLVIVIFLLFAGLTSVIAQEPPHPPAEHGLLDNNDPGNGTCNAPLNGGVSILITFGIAYGYMKMRNFSHKKST
ncbi:MAG: hypothetical protein IPH45_09725 [Bacteroidales bacterium]|nr:hypothetical protein [Bacteroidales bacterium]